MGGGAYSLASTFFPPRSANEHRLATKVVETRSQEREEPVFTRVARRRICPRRRGRRPGPTRWPGRGCDEPDDVAAGTFSAGSARKGDSRASAATRWPPGSADTPRTCE